MKAIGHKHAVRLAAPEQRQVLFVRDRYNKHSMAALAGALDSRPPESPTEPLFVRAEDVERLLERDGRPGQELLLACSFHTSHLPAMAAWVGRIRECAARHGVRIVFLSGGTHASGDPETTLLAGFDYAYQGEGEPVAGLLVDVFARGGSLEELPGLTFHHGEALQQNPRPPLVDLDDYLPFSPARRLLSPIEVSRGCPGACGFCQTPFLFGVRMRHRRLDRVLEACAGAKAAGLKDLRFVTTNAFAYGSPDGRTPNPAMVEQLLLGTGRLFGKDHIYYGSFPSETRPESVTAEIVALIRRLAGNDNLVIGMQSGSDDFLERLRRGHTTDDVFRAVEIAVAAGFRIYVDFIFGLPGEEEADRLATERVIERLSRMGATVHGHAFIPLPGTPLWNRPPQEIGPSTRRLMESLPPGSHCGRWKQQEAEARAVLHFRREHLASRRRNRP